MSSDYRLQLRTIYNKYSLISYGLSNILRKRCSFVKAKWNTKQCVGVKWNPKRYFLKKRYRFFTLVAISMSSRRLWQSIPRPTHVVRKQIWNTLVYNFTCMYVVCILWMRFERLYIYIELLRIRPKLSSRYIARNSSFEAKLRFTTIIIIIFQSNHLWACSSRSHRRRWIQPFSLHSTNLLLQFMWL